MHSRKRQAKAKARAEARTIELVFLFFLAATGNACVLFLPILISSCQNPNLWHSLVTFNTFIGCFSIALAIISLSALYKAIQLRSGGKTLAEDCGGTPVTEPSDPLERRFVEIARELSNSSKINQPCLYVLRNESCINAFVAGHGPKDTVMVVTRGALEELSREELKNVIAHEFSHIKNGDMLLNTNLIAIVFGVSSMAQLGAFFARSGGYGRYLGWIVFAAGYIGTLCAQAIQAGISRQRELLADSSAIGLTHNPKGMAGALNKAGSGRNGSATRRDLSYLNHMMLSDCRRTADAGWSVIATALRQKFDSLFASHPPLAERIRAVDPSFKFEEDI